MRKRTSSFAVGMLAMAVLLTAVAANAQTGEGWHWSIMPYMWATDITEDLIVDGSVIGGEDTDFDDIVDKIDTSLQLHLEGTGNRWGLFADLNFVELSDSETGEQGIGRFDVDIEEVVIEGGGIYRPGGSSGKLDLLVGFRHLSLDETYSLSLGDLDPFATRVDEGYLDLLLGARYNIALSDRWMLSLKGDYSAGGTDYIWTGQGMLGWRFGKKRNSGIFVGYRYRAMKYDKADVVEVKKTLSGPGLGLRIGF